MISAWLPPSLPLLLSVEELVPRFYFDIRQGPDFIPDDEGWECDDLDAAERELAEAAAQIAWDELRESRAPDVIVEVRNERFQRVLIATVSTHIDWVLHPPAWVAKYP
jgi:hypothetical protein